MRASRAQIADATSRSRFGAEDMILLNHAPPVTSEEAWIALSYAANGGLSRRDTGPVSLSVH
jgi:hypothetical protein